MPTIEVQCLNGHTDVQYLRTWNDASCTAKVCDWCGHTMAQVPSFGTPLLYFRENRKQYIDNLDATIASHGEHTRVMKERGVEPATDWHTSKSRSDGLVPKVQKPHPVKGIV